MGDAASIFSLGDISRVGTSVAGAAKGGGSPQNVNIPPFYSSGGITPEQETLAQYGKQEANVATGNTFGASGTGMSTMATQGAAGNRMGQAVAEGTMSNTDEDAMYKAYQNDVTAAEQNLTNQTTLNNLATQQLTSAITQGANAANTASNNSQFTQGANDVFNSTGA